MTPTDFIKEMTLRIPNYQVTEEQKPVLRQIFDYFSAEKQAKGLLLYGGVGTGKTSIMKAYSFLLQSTTKRFKIYPEIGIYDIFDMEGVKGLQELKRNPVINGYDVSNDNPLNICIDDLGVQMGKVMRYGNTYNLMDDLLTDRYYLMQEFGVTTHATSNATTKDMEKLNARTLDRMKEMFLLINLPGRSFRQ